MNNTSYIQWLREISRLSGGFYGAVVAVATLSVLLVTIFALAANTATTPTRGTFLAVGFLCSGLVGFLLSLVLWPLRRREVNAHRQAAAGTQPQPRVNFGVSEVSSFLPDKVRVYFNIAPKSPISVWTSAAQDEGIPVEFIHHEGNFDSSFEFTHLRLTKPMFGQSGVAWVHAIVARRKDLRIDQEEVSQTWGDREAAIASRATHEATFVMAGDYANCSMTWLFAATLAAHFDGLLVFALENETPRAVAGAVSMRFAREAHAKWPTHVETTSAVSVVQHAPQSEIFNEAHALLRSSTHWFFGSCAMSLAMWILLFGFYQLPASVTSTVPLVGLFLMITTFVLTVSLWRYSVGRFLVTVEGWNRVAA